MEMTEEQSQIVIYEALDNAVTVEVLSDGDTVWLTQQQMALLFDTTRENVVQHIGNVYQEEELFESATCKKTLQVQIEGKREVKRERPHYNLDMILSVGYRVKSKAATHFRRWANDVLKHYLVDGAVVNNRRLKQMDKIVNILSRSSDDMVSGIANVLQDFTTGLDLLDNYDHQTLTKPKGNTPGWELTYDEARSFIDTMKFSETSDLFGFERDESFKGIVAGLYQSFGEVDLYPSVQEKAANLLYLIVKDHSFIDGNKRIAAALFVYFLEKNGALRSASGQQLVGNNALAAITLMIALSAPEEKDIMCLLVTNMLDAE
jgi:prophage maintenance system killer protein